MKVEAERGEVLDMGAARRAGRPNVAVEYVSQLMALVYKNLLLMRRNFQSTFVYALFPAITIAILGLALNGAFSGAEDSLVRQTFGGSGDLLPRCLVFDKPGGRYGVGGFFPDAECITISYSPQSPRVEQVMRKMAELNNLNFEEDFKGYPSSDNMLAAFSVRGATPSFAAVAFRDNGTLSFPMSDIQDQFDGINPIYSLPLDVDQHVLPYEVWYNQTVTSLGLLKLAGIDRLSQSLPASWSGEIADALVVQRAVNEALLATHAQDGKASLEVRLKDFPLERASDSVEVSGIVDNLAVGMVLTFGVMVGFVVGLRQMLQEKEDRLVDGLRMMGLYESCYWISWMLYFALYAAISSVLVAATGRATNISVFVDTDFGLMWTLLFLFMCSVSSIAMLLSSLLPSVRLGMSFGALFMFAAIVLQFFLALPNIRMFELMFDPRHVDAVSQFFIKLYTPILFTKVLNNMIKYSSEHGSYTWNDAASGYYQFISSRSRLKFEKNVTQDICVESNACMISHVSCGDFSQTCEDTVCSYDWGYVATKQECLAEGGIMKEDYGCECTFSLESDLDSMRGLALATFLFMILAWYFGQVFTHGHGKAEAPWFPLTPWYWLSSFTNPFSSRGSSPSNTNTSGEHDDDDVMREAEAVLSGQYGDTDTYPVVLRNLVKDFRGLNPLSTPFRAVDGVTLGLKLGECFALLGHNGAGKTTAINMLSGMTSISGGDCSIFGSSVKDNMSTIRHDVSVCPQHDILWSQLTAREHLMFYGLFQGMSIATVKKQSQALLKHVHLDTLKRSAGQYSGGMRRRLSMTIAALGNKRVIFLDEPTTGLDPQNQRHVWDLINELKKDRVVILTTHLMEEADILGDRIGIMSKGRMMALGNALHLKSKFGGSYTATINPSQNVKGSRDVIATQVASILTSYRSKPVPQTGPLVYSIGPSSFERAPELFDSIDKHLASGLAEDWALSQTTLEDVFVSLESSPVATVPAFAEDSRLFNESDEGIEVPIAESAVNAERNSPLPEDTREYHPTNMSQIRALLLKSFVLQKRQVCTLFCQLIIPVALLGIYIFILSKVGNPADIPLEPGFGVPDQGELIVNPTQWSGPNLLTGVNFDLYSDELGHGDVMVAVSKASLKDVVGSFSNDEALLLVQSDAVTCEATTSPLFPEVCLVAGRLQANVTELLLEKRRNATGVLKHFPVGLYYERDRYFASEKKHLFASPVLRPIASYPNLRDVDDPEVAIDNLLRESQIGEFIVEDEETEENYDEIRKLLQENFPTNALIFHELDLETSKTSVTIQGYIDGFPYGLGVLRESQREREYPTAIGPRLTRTYSQYIEIQRTKSQYLINGLTSALLAANESPSSTSPLADAVRPILMVGMRPFPYSQSDFEDITDAFGIVELLESTGALMLSLSTIFLLPVLVSHLVYEKEHKLRSSMLMMGLDMRMYWMVQYLFDLILTLSALMVIYIVCIVADVAAFAKHDFGIVLVLLLLWANAMIALSFFFSLFFSRTRNANIAMYLLVQLASGASIAVQLLVFSSRPFLPAPGWWVWFPPFAYFRAITLLTQRTFLWSDLSGDAELVQIWGYLILSTVVLVLVTVYLDQILPKEFGTRRRPLFCLEDLVRGIRKRTREKDVDLESEAEYTESVGESSDPDVNYERHLVDHESQESRDAKIQVKHLRKRFGGFVAVKDLCLTFFDGCSALLGPNGAGKSTTLQILTGLYGPSGGDATVAGYSIRTDMPAIHKQIGVCPQHDVFFPSLTLREHLLLFARLKGCRKSEEQDLVSESLRSVKLLEHGHKYARQLSGGQLRRMSIAIAFIGNPKVVFLDEPTTGVDPVTRADVHNMIMQEKKRRSIILTTHLMSEAEGLSDKIAIMAHGELRTVGTASSLKSKFNTGFKLILWVVDEAATMLFMSEKLPNATLVAQTNHRFTFQFDTKTTVSLAEVWTLMQAKETEKEGGFSDWQISATSLSDVFLQIAGESEAQYGTA